MAQEFVIKSTALEDKINQLLPSQGGAQAGVDLSASTMVVPIVDLTESAEGSNVRQDIQKAISHDNATTFTIQNATNTVIVNTTGYWKIQASVFAYSSTGTRDGTCSMNLFDGTTSKDLFDTSTAVTTTNGFIYGFYIQEQIVKLNAGDSLRATADEFSRICGTVNQIADINGNLT